MGVIESLQRKCEENCEPEEDPEGAPENVAAAAKDADEKKKDMEKPEDPEGQVKVDNDETESAAAETKPKGNSKRENCNDIDALAVVDAGVAAKGSKRVKVAAATWLLIQWSAHEKSKITVDNNCIKMSFPCRFLNKT